MEHTRRITLNEGSTVGDFMNVWPQVFDDDKLRGFVWDYKSLSRKYIEMESVFGVRYAPAYIGINDLHHDKITLHADPITDALKKVNSDGYVVENLDRDKYLELYTPLFCKREYIATYFENFDYWSLSSFVNLNKEKVEYVIL